MSNQPSNTTPAAGEEDTKFLFFGLNSTELQANATPYLREVVAQLKSNPALNVELVGHADDSGGKDYNLSCRLIAAQEAKRYLTAQGIEAARIITYGRGSTQPLSEGDDPDTKRKNRRVEIKIDR